MKIAIVGMGNVGAATAHALVCEGLADDLVLVSRDHRKAEGNALDLMHAAAILPYVTRIRGGGPELLAGADLIILTHSVPTERPGRHLLAEGNGRLFRETLPLYLAESPDAVVLVISNPVDALTWLTLEISNLPPARVIGSGAIIDSARLRSLLSKRHRIHPDDLRVYVLGEHGEEQFPAVSLASAGAVRFDDPEDVRRLFERAKQSAFDILQQKGHTCYSVAQASALVARTIKYNERRTLPVSTLIDGYLDVENVCLSLPCVVGRSGIERVLYPKLAEDEIAAFRRGAESVRRTIEALG